MAAGDGLVTMTPTSIVVAGAGSSASINSDGGVDFTSATELSLNGVFTSGFDNYIISVLVTGSSAQLIEFRMRAAGTDNSTASSYTRQSIYADGSAAPGGSRSTGTRGRFCPTYGTVRRTGFAAHIYGPYLAQPTATRAVSASDYLGAYIEEHACTHNQSTSYDGITFLPEAAGNFSGNIVVFGYEE